jgi:hypothetical protein
VRVPGPMTALRRNQVVSSIVAITSALGILMLLTYEVSYAAQQTIEWFDDLQCSSSIKFDPKKYDEQRLRNTIAVIFTSRSTGNAFPDISPDIPVHPTSAAGEHIEQYRQLCEATIRRGADLAVIDLPGIEAYRKLKLEELDDGCKFSAIKIRAAAGEPSALRSFAPSAAKCSPFIDALEGKVDIVTFWREMVNSNCQNNSSPSTCRAYHFSHQGEADGMDWVRHDILTYGWNNCSTPYLKVADRKRSEEMQTALAREFGLRFKIKKCVCSD